MKEITTRQNYHCDIDFYIPTDSWEQAAQDQTKWHCLVKKGATQYEAKGNCKADRKRKERKESAKGSISESSRYAFTCSICNQQFRAKNGLNSHQHTITHEYVIFRIEDGLSQFLETNNHNLNA